MAGMYYENAPATLTVPANSSKVLALDYPNRVRLVKLNIVQEGSTNFVTFQADLYNAQVADAASADLSDYKWLITDPAGIQSDAAGRLNHRFADFDVFFINQDTDASVNNQVTAHNVVQPSTVRTSALKRYTVYLRITNKDLAHPATFDIVLGSESPHEL